LGLVGLVWVLLLGACGEPASCQRLRGRVCEVCGDQSPACQRLQDKSGGAQQCEQTLGELDDLLKRLQTLPAEEAAERTLNMCSH
jgi:hypothetical protein